MSAARRGRWGASMDGRVCAQSRSRSAVSRIAALAVAVAIASGLWAVGRPHGSALAQPGDRDWSQSQDRTQTQFQAQAQAAPPQASAPADLDAPLPAGIPRPDDATFPPPAALEAAASASADRGVAPDRIRETLGGRLSNEVVGCSPSNAALYECSTGMSIPLRALTSISPSLFGREVSIEGYWTDCSSGVGRYFVIESIVPAPCGAPTPTPAPSPAPARDNLAYRAPVTASGEMPGRIKEYLTDGDPATEWHAPASGLVYASIDLGSERAFNSFVLRWGEAYAKRFAIYVWDTRLGDKGDWHRVHYVTNGRGGDEEITIARADSRYILIWLVDSALPEDGFTLREWEVYGVEAPNMALGCAAHVSSAAAGFPAYHANDNNLGTQWSSDPDIVPADRTPYIYVRCPARIDFSTLRLFWDDEEWPRYYRVAFYQDGSLLPIWFSADNPDGGLDWFSLPSEISIDTVLVFVDVKRSGSRAVRLAEFELYGLAAGAEADVVGDARHAGPAPDLGAGIAQALRFGVRGGGMRLTVGGAGLGAGLGAGPGTAPGWGLAPALGTGPGGGAGFAPERPQPLPVLDVRR